MDDKKLGATDVKLWWVFFATALAIMMVDIDVSAVNLALTTIGREFHTGIITLKWIVSGYMIAAASLMAFGGRLCDIVGSKRVFLGGLSAFAFASVAVGCSVGPLSIIVSRIVQGACIAFTLPVAITVVRQVFPKHLQGFVGGLMFAIAGFSQALGPTIGGIIIHLLSWRWIFWVNIPLVMLALLLVVRYVPSKTIATKQPIPFLGAVILSIGLLTLMAAINEISRLGVTSFLFLLLLLIAMMALFIFSLMEWKAKDPILDLRLLMNRNFMFISMIRFLLTFVYFALLFVLGLLLQNFLGYSVLHAGYVLLALTLALGTVSIPAGKCVDKIGPKPLIISGALLLASGVFLLSFINQSSSLLLLIIGLMFSGAGVSILMTATGAAALFAVTPEKSGAAMGVLISSGFIGASVGAASTGLFLSLYSDYKLKALLVLKHIPLLPHQIVLLNKIASGAQGFQHKQALFSPGVAKTLSSMVGQAFFGSFQVLMLSCMFLSLLAFLLALGLKLLPTVRKV